MKRFLTWHQKEPSNPFGPVHILESDYFPINLTIYAVNAPSSGDLEVEIRDDGVSILANRASSYINEEEVLSEISYGATTLATGYTKDAAFALNESISGGTSGAKGNVVSQQIGLVRVRMTSAASFAANEIITGATSTTSATSASFFRGSKSKIHTSDASNKSTILSKSDNLNDMAGDFASDETLGEGSAVSCYIVKASGASDITVQLELETLEEEEP